MKRLFFSLCAVLLLNFVAAKTIPLIVHPDTHNRVGKDSVPNTLSEEEMEEASSGPYFNWDTTNIHSPKFNVKSLDSIRELTLCDESGCGYVHPFLGNVTSSFGPRKKTFHYGIDIDLETGDQVVAAFDGRVRIAKRSATYGNVIVIRHHNGLETYYAHLSKINVEVDQEVFAGQPIGLGGNTGRSRGSHLHFEIRYLGQPINPKDMICFEDYKLLSDTFSLSKASLVFYSLDYSFQV